MRRLFHPRSRRSRTPFAWAPTPWATRSTWARPGRTWRSASSAGGARRAGGSAGRPWGGPSPRGREVEAKGGKGSLYARGYAGRVAEERGADVVKLHEPAEDPGASPE